MEVTVTVIDTGSEKIGQDVVSCIDTLSHSINDIKHEMQDKIQTLLNR